MSETGERGGIRERIVDDYAGYKLYDERGGKVGKVEYTVLDAEGRPEYLAVKTGFFGSNTTLIPEGVARPGERDNEFEVQASEDQVKDAPTFSDEDDVTPDFEDRVLSHFGLGRGGESSGGAAGAAGAAAGSSSESRDREDRETRDDESRDRGSGYSDDEGRSRDDDRAFSESRDRESRSDNRSAESRFDDRDRQADDRDSGAAGLSRGTGRDDRRDDRSSSGGGREKVRVTVKRERARAERVRGEDGQEEVRIRKEMIEEEEMVEVEDRLS